MIHRAIQELNEEGGSSEESISKFIRKEYNDLPWAHSTFLNHHLGKLCESGEIVLTLDNSYLLAGAIMKEKPSPSSSLGSKRKELKRKWSKKQGRKRGRAYKKEEIEEEYLPSLEYKRKELKKKRSKKQGRKRGRPYKKEETEEEYELKELMEVIEEQNQVLEDRTKVVDEENQAQNSEMLQSSDDGEKGDGSKLALPVDSLGAIMEEEKKDFSEEEEQLMKSPGEESSDIIVFQPQQQLYLPVPEKSSELKSIAELSCTQDQLDQQTQEKPQHRILRPRPPKAGSLTATSMTESLTSQHQHEEQQQLESQAQEERKEFSDEEEQLMKSLGEESSDLVVFQPQQQLDLPVPEKFSEQKSMAELSCTQDQPDLKRKELKKKRSKKLGRKRGRPYKKEEIEEEYHSKEPMEVIEEQNQVLEDRTKVVDKQNQAQNSEMLQSSDDFEKGDGSKLEVLPVESLGPIIEEEKNEFSEEKEQLMKSPGEESSDIVGLQPQQQLVFPVLEKSSEPKSMTELSCTQNQLEQRAQEKPQRRILRPRPPKAGSLTATSMAESLPSEHHHEEQRQPESQAQEEKKEFSEEEEQLMKSPGEESVDIVGLLPQQRLDLPVSEESSELKSIAELSCTQDQRTQEKLPPRRILRPRLPKAGSLTATSMTESLPSQPVSRGQGRPRKQQEKLEQPEYRGRGRPRKLLEQPEYRGRGRPKQQQEQPKCRGRGRPPNAQTN